MITTIEVICYKSKVLKNNEHPLMLRVTKDRKRKYLSLGISINPIYWDFNKNKPKRNCPNKEHILQVVSEKKKTFSDQIMELKAMDRDFTPTSLIEKVNLPIKLKTIDKHLLDQIEKLTNEKRTNYALSHKQLYNSLIQFHKHLDIYF